MTPTRYAIILGAMKCGTTTLFERLADHPGICPCSVKEPDFFSDERQWKRGIGPYAALWQFDPSRHRIALEASTSYTMHPRVPCPAERIAQLRDGLDADVRFIYMMRDPIERIESEIRHEIGNGRRHPDKPIDEVPPDMIAVSNYASQLDPYRERFGRERLLLFSLDDLRDEPDRVLRDVCTFLDIDASFAFPAQDAMANRARNYNPLYYWLAQVPGLPWLARHSPLGPRKAIRRVLARPVDQSIGLSDAQREHVMTQLRPDLERLRPEYGFDASRWLA